jgi:hypothetical protein
VGGGGEMTQTFYAHMNRKKNGEDRVGLGEKERIKIKHFAVY